MSRPPVPPPRRRSSGFAPPVDAVAAAVRLEVAADAMRAEHLQAGRDDDEPPTGLIDRAAIRAAVAAGPVAEPVNPASAAWLAGASPADAMAAARLACDVVALAPADREPIGQLGGQSVAEIMAEIEAMVDQNMTASAAPLPAPPPLPPGPTPAAAPSSAPVFSSEHGRLNWRPRHDERSLGFGVRRVLAAAVPLTDRLWFPGEPLDQGVEGACVGFGTVNALNAMAAADRDRDAADARHLYHLAQQLDEVPGESYAGTSVLAGLKAAHRLGFLTGYRWCFGTRDVAQAVLQSGPVIVGVPWLEGMYATGPGGLVRLEGPEVGGHCLAVVGLRMTGPQGQPGPYFVWQNSWGADYGDDGLGYVHHRDLARLLAGVGEAALPQVAA